MKEVCHRHWEEEGGARVLELGLSYMRYHILRVSFPDYLT